MAKPKPTIPLVCKQCGNEFLTWKDRVDRGQMFCSIPCSMQFRKQPVADRFRQYLAPQEENGCINWTGGCNKWGYGKFSDCGKTLGAHRVAWEQANGAIPEGLWVLHRCDNRLCCNPAHLFLGTVQDNMDDCCAKQRIARGSRQGNHKLSEDQVASIREQYATGNVTQTALAREFGVKQPVISSIVLRDNWKHV